MQCIRADVSVGTIQMETPALLGHSRLVIYGTEIALGTETSYVHIRVRNESKRYPVSKRMRFTMREGSVMSWKPRKCVIALLTLATLTCSAALIAVNIKPQHDAYPSSLSIKMGQDFGLGRNVNYFNKLKPNEENILMFWASWCQHCESLIEDMQQLDNFAALRGGCGRFLGPRLGVSTSFLRYSIGLSHPRDFFIRSSR